MLIYLTLPMQVWEIGLGLASLCMQVNPGHPNPILKAEKKGVSSLVLYSAPLISRGSEGAHPYLPLLLGFGTVVFLQ